MFQLEALCMSHALTVMYLDCCLACMLGLPSTGYHNVLAIALGLCSNEHTFAAGWFV